MLPPREMRQDCRNKWMTMIERITFLIFSTIFRFLPATRLFKMKSYILKLSGANVDLTTRLHSQIAIDNKYFEIGKNTWIGGGTRIIGHHTALVYIGDYCDIAPDCLFIVGSHELGNSKRRAGNGFAKPIRVGNGTWIGARSTILGGVRIGRGCVIAAGSTVVSDILENTMVGGCPAKFIKNLD